MQECFNCTEPIIVPQSGGEGGRIPLPISTPSLTLRKFREADWKGLLQLFSDDEFFSVSSLKLDGEEQVTRWLAEDATIKLTTPGVPFTLAVETLENPKIIGLLSLRFSNAERSQVAIDLVLHREFRRRGFGLEALNGALEFCFGGISLHRVQAFCDSANAAACGLLAKAGLRREGEFVRDHKTGDDWANTMAYAMLREEFKSGQ